MRFTTEVEATGKNTTGIPVPEAVVEELGGGKRARVAVTVGGHTYRSSIASMAGRFMVSLSAENRAQAGVESGDEVEVTIELDTAPREVSVPVDLAGALESDPTARAAFEALSYSRQLRHVLDVEGARTAATRQRRVDKVLAGLHAANQETTT